MTDAPPPDPPVETEWVPPDLTPQPEPPLLAPGEIHFGPNLVRPEDHADEATGQPVERPLPWLT